MLIYRVVRLHQDLINNLQINVGPNEKCEMNIMLLFVSVCSFCSTLESEANRSASQGVAKVGCLGMHRAKKREFARLGGHLASAYGRAMW